MKSAALLLSALCLLCVSCERHTIEETKHLYEEHSAHAEDDAHGDAHGKEHDKKGHDAAAH